MKTHTTLGRDSIVAAERLLNTPTSFLRVAREIAWTHHERWDGTGYPRALAGEEIGIAGRLMAVVDVVRRAHQQADLQARLSPRDCRFNDRGRGGHPFDPDIVDAFTKNAESFRRIANAYHDGGARRARRKPKRCPLDFPREISLPHGTLLSERRSQWGKAFLR